MTRFDRPLPLPGERPGTVWQPRRRRTTPRGSINWRVVGVFTFVVALGVLGWLWNQGGTPVTVFVNGAPVRLRAHSADVAGAVMAAGVSREDTAFVDPPLDTPLEPDASIVVLAWTPVTIHADGATRVVQTRSLDIVSILAGAGVTIGPADRVRIDREVRFSPVDIAANPVLASAPVIPRELTVVRAAPIVVSQNGSQVGFQTTAATLGEALIAAGYTLYEGDIVSPPPDTRIPPEGLQASITAAIPVMIAVDGRSIATRTSQPTVGGLLGELGLAAGSGDYTIPGPETPVSEGMTIRLVRSYQQPQEERLPIPFATIFIPDPDMELDQQREVQAGQEGVRIRRSAIQMEDGIEVSHVVTDEWVEKQPQARIVAYGTRIVIRTLQTAEGTIKYWRQLRVLATSYSPSTAGDKKPGDPRFGISGTGAVLKRGVVAVDTRVIALGTRLYVPEYGEGMALDVGGAVKGLRIDLGYEDPLPRHWNDWTDLYLMLPVPSPDQIIWVIPNFTPE
jgi:uncharacterized protein YabE (DUF348 family)